MSQPDLTRVVTIGRRDHVEIAHLQPREARAMLLDAVLGALEQHGVRAFVVKGVTWPGATVGVAPGHRESALEALAQLPGPGLHLQESYPTAVGTQPIHAFSAASVHGVPAHCPALTLARYWSVAGGALTYGLAYGVRVEFWSDAGDGTIAAPVPNAAAQFVEPGYLAPATAGFDGVDRPSIALFDRVFVDEVDFPIDAVYTWVDGDDPRWRERMERARAEAEGVEYHPAAQAEHRFRARDELRYSLRSMASYAPWIRHVYLVTDGQVPTWLDRANPKITVVDHREIFDDPTVLPVFNSSAIITQLHHIPDLAEHYLYLNDDMFFGRDVRPEMFWHGSGIAKVFPAELTRPFGAAHAGDAPQFNITKNIRTLLERELHRSVSTALRHTPYPQLRSVNYEIERRFADAIQATARRRFRHHDDVALDQLFHYYAQATGRAVPSTDIEYAYVNVSVADEALHRMRRALAVRDADTICLNDAPDPGARPTSDRDIAEFLEAYFPLASSFELAPTDAPRRAT